MTPIFTAPQHRSINLSTRCGCAVAAGAKVVAQPEDKSDGDRRGGVDDPFGFTWWMATQLRPLSREEMQQQTDSAKA